MSRGSSAAMIAAHGGDQLQPFNLVHLAFDSGDVRIWTGHGDLSWGGFTWTGAHSLLGISASEETGQVESKGITLSLSGLPADILAIALAEDYQGRRCTVYLGEISGGAVVVDPVVTFRGEMDTMPITDGGTAATVTLKVENRLVILHRSRNRRWTSADQKIDFPDDKGFDFVQSIQEQPIEWGQNG